ncbi:hypothetical protein Ancab_005909 [Ancistrocladus abbreviatus]
MPSLKKKRNTANSIANSQIQNMNKLNAEKEDRKNAEDPWDVLKKLGVICNSSAVEMIKKIEALEERDAQLHEAKTRLSKHNRLGELVMINEALILELQRHWEHGKKEGD